MSGIFSSPKPVAPAPAPGPSSAEIAQSKVDARRRAANNRGRQSALLGGSVGSQSQQKRLLGQ